MADNVTADAGAGGAIFVAASLSFSGDTAVVPGTFVGILSGSEGSWTYSLIVGGAGAVAAGVQRVTLASDDPAVAHLATIAGDTTAIETAIQIIDDWDESDRAKVNIVVGQAGVTAGAGSVAANTPRVTLASDDPAVASLAILDNIVAGSEAQVDIVAALPAGTNNIGDVDVLSIVPGTAATNLGKAIDTATGGTDTGVLALATRDDALSALTPVEGDNVQLRTDANGALWVIPSGTITVASHAVTNAGTFVVQVDGAALTALQLIDDVVYTDDTSTHATGTSKGVLMMAAATPTDTAVNANDIGAVAMTVNRELQVNLPNALPAGTNGIGKLTANAGVTIGAVEIASAQTLATVANVATIGTSVTPGTAAANLGKAEDAAHTTGDVGVMVLGVRAAAPTERSAGPTDGDYEPFGINEVGAGWMTDTGSANGGLTTFRSIDLDETEEEVKATAGTIYNIAAFNRTAAPLYLKLYNATAANVTVGSTTPTHTYVVPANADSDGAGFILSVGKGIAFATAISAAVTTGVADADTGAPGANDAVVNIQYR